VGQLLLVEGLFMEYSVLYYLLGASIDGVIIINKRRRGAFFRGSSYGI